MGRDDPERAAAAARSALAVAERAGLHEVACEALEVVGRRARLTDDDLAETAFARALEIAVVVCHIANLTVKAGVRRRSELIAFAARSS